MLTLAVTTYDGLVVDDYYEKGLQINRSMERDGLAERYELASIVMLGPSGGAIEARLQGSADFEAPEVVNEVVGRTVGEILDEGKLPAVVGGDHSVPFGAIAAVASSASPSHRFRALSRQPARPRARALVRSARCRRVATQGRDRGHAGCPAFTARSRRAHDEVEFDQLSRLM